MILHDDYMNTAIKKRGHFVIVTGAIISCIMSGIEISIMQLIEKNKSKNGEDERKSI